MRVLTAHIRVEDNPVEFRYTVTLKPNQPPNGEEDRHEHRRFRQQTR